MKVKVKHILNTRYNPSYELSGTFKSPKYNGTYWLEYY